MQHAISQILVGDPFRPQPQARQRRPQVMTDGREHACPVIEQNADAGTATRSGRSPHFGCGMAITAASARSGWPTAAFLQVNRAGPPAAQSDHVLGLIGDVHAAEPVDGRDVAGCKPALGSPRDLNERKADRVNATV
jgi:hypothetical protein